jgi:hypothetical protein
VSRDIHAYRQVAVQSILERGVVRIRPMPGQAYSPYLSVACSSRLRDTSLYPVGTCFLLSAKLTDRQGGTPFLYAWHGDPDAVLTPAQAKKFLAEFRRGRI